MQVSNKFPWNSKGFSIYQIWLNCTQMQTYLIYLFPNDVFHVKHVFSGKSVKLLSQFELLIFIDV